MLKFTKLQGLGNDFVLVHGQAEAANIAWDALAPRLCDRHYGVGSDGVLLMQPGQAAPWRMTVINADGSVPETCGNGLRCAARWIREHGGQAHDRFAIETGAGALEVAIVREAGGAIAGVRVDMGRPRLARSEIPMRGPASPVVLDEPLTVGGHCLRLSAVSMGNPHAVLFQEEEGQYEELAKLIEAHEAFPARVNVEFVWRVAFDRLAVKVYERGVGWTLACGSGACAAVVAGVLTGRCARETTVELPGGDLAIAWPEDGSVSMTGPAEEVFAGQLELARLGSHGDA